MRDSGPVLPPGERNDDGDYLHGSILDNMGFAFHGRKTFKFCDFTNFTLNLVHILDAASQSLVPDADEQNSQFALLDGIGKCYYDFPNIRRVRHTLLTLQQAALRSAKKCRKLSLSYTRSRILESRDFVVNVPDAKLMDVTNYIGSVSGPWPFKMKGMKTQLGKRLTLAASTLVKSPRIEEFYLNFECRVLNTIQIGLYDCFIGQVLTMWTDQDLYKNDHPRGRLDSKLFSPLFCIADEYWTSGKKIGISGENKKHFHGPQH